MPSHEEHIRSERTTSIAMSLAADQGGLALLLGSGVSRSASIPTGWEIVEDLIRKFANLEGEDPGTDPAAWHQQRFGAPADYGKLLERLAPTMSQRRALLKPYFEPTDAEREQGLKVPTKAHRAIAQLIRKHHVRVVVTTNFDRLIERSLEEVGIVPVVLSTPSAASGAWPLDRSTCTVVKINGDYLDARLRNTDAELGKLEPAFRRLLARILEEYGLIICGWSGEWDQGLRDQMAVRQVHRYPWYWCLRSEPVPVARDLITLSRAITVPIIEADSFWGDLAERVDSLGALAVGNPITPKLASATLKRLIVDEKNRVQVRDMVMEETEQLYRLVTGVEFDVSKPAPDSASVAKRLELAENSAAALVRLFATGHFWLADWQLPIWQESQQRLINFPDLPGTYYSAWRSFRSYPALLITYAAGIVLVSREGYRSLPALLMNPRIGKRPKDEPLVRLVHTWMDKVYEAVSLIPEHKDKKTPFSDRIFSHLRDPLREWIRSDQEYEEAFDRFEYICGLIVADICKREIGRVWGPLGRYSWKEWGENPMMKSVDLEIEQHGKVCEMLGDPRVFGAALGRFIDIKKEFDAIIRSQGF